MTNAESQSPGSAAPPASHDRPDARALLEHEWRRTRMPGELHCEIDGRVRVSGEAWGSPVSIRSPLGIAAVLQYFPPAPEEGASHLVGLMRRVLLETVPEPGQVAEWSALVEVLRDRAIPILRREHLALVATGEAFEARTEFDAYVATVKNFESSVSDPTNSGMPTDEPVLAATRPPGGPRQLLRPDLADIVGLLSTAEFIARWSHPSTAGFWELLCGELAAHLRASIATDEPVTASSRSHASQGRCRACGALTEDAQSPSCRRCVAGAPAGPRRLETETSEGAAEAKNVFVPDVKDLVEYIEATGELAAAAAMVSGQARWAEESSLWLVGRPELAALRTALATFSDAGGALALHLVANLTGGASEEGTAGA